MTSNEPVVRCVCCELRFPEPIPLSVVNGAGLCTTCKHHQSKEIGQTVKRLSEHEAALRERLVTADSWAREVAGQIKEAKQQRHFAYRTRDKAAVYLQQIADAHNMRPDGNCVCKAKNCRVAKILDDGLARKIIADVDKVQEDMRRKEQLYKELRYADFEEIDEMLSAEGLGYLDGKRDTA